MDQTLTPEPPVEKPKLRLVRANNPSAMTFTGTNSYLLGQGQVVLIDPGPDLSGHVQAILAALAPGERIAAILLTHGHADHVGGLPAVQAATGAASYGFGPPGSGRSAAMQALLDQGLNGAGEGFDPGYAPDHVLTDRQTLTPAGFPIHALHTPGHTGCSLSFAVGDWLFTGDLAMGWATSLVSPPDGDMAAYLASLTRLAAGHWRRAFPGHGDPIDDPAQRLAGLIAHRQNREAQIRAALTQGLTTIPAITAQIYRDTPPALIPAAQRNVLAHLIDLVTRGHVLAHPNALPDAHFTLV